MTESIQFASDSSEHHHAAATAHASQDDEQQLLNDARSEGQRQQLPFAGSVAPPHAWRLINAGLATLVDVRTAEERKFVGHIPDSLHVAWMTGLSMNRNPRFVKEFEIKVKNKSEVVLLLCRSGKRSAAAAEALAKNGFDSVFNIEGGFEGEINEQQQRGALGGWRSHSLPWVQD